MGMLKKIRVTTYITKDVRDKLKELSDKTRVPQAQYFQEAVEDLLKKYDKVEPIN